MRINNSDYIVADNNVCHGQLTFKGTRIMVWQVLDLLAAGVTIEEILKDYFPELSKEAIFAVF
mgnify:CR=1 FL=1